jgi:hypothetical protein
MPKYGSMDRSGQGCRERFVYAVRAAQDSARTSFNHGIPLAIELAISGMRCWQAAQLNRRALGTIETSEATAEYA